MAPWYWGAPTRAQGIWGRRHGAHACSYGRVVSWGKSPVEQSRSSAEASDFLDAALPLALNSALGRGSVCAGEVRAAGQGVPEGPMWEGHLHSLRGEGAALKTVPWGSVSRPNGRLPEP